VHSYSRIPEYTGYQINHSVEDFRPTLLEVVLQFTLMIEKNRTKDLLNYEQYMRLQSALLCMKYKPDAEKPRQPSALKKFLFNFGIPKSTRALF
jgi:hypothetical protein